MHGHSDEGTGGTPQIGQLGKFRFAAMKLTELVKRIESRALLSLRILLIQEREQVSSLKQREIL